MLTCYVSLARFLVKEIPYFGGVACFPRTRSEFATSESIKFDEPPAKGIYEPEMKPMTIAESAEIALFL